jgi:dTDP-4-dehydrorhamnose 3,5-epimerase
VGNFEFRKTGIEGLWEIEVRSYGDGRGRFRETYSEREFAAAGLVTRFAQDNESVSERGVLRGMHFQKSRPQGKLVRAIQGEAFDVAVDMRAGSPTYGKWHGVTLSGERGNQFYISEGFAHGFLAMSERVVFAYKCTDFYCPEDEGGLAWDDPDIGIAWPDTGTEYILSEKDRRWGGLRALRGAAG